MGFFDAVGKMIQGKPVFDDPGNKPPASTPPAAGVPISSEPPVVVLARTSCYTRGSDIEIQCDIRNQSSENVMLDKIRMLGNMVELDHFMKPGEAREFVIYRGPQPRDTSQHYAELTYRSDSGQYWQAVHMIVYHQESNGSFMVSEFKQQMPIRQLQ